jgi:hypothetical protein
VMAALEIGTVITEKATKVKWRVAATDQNAYVLQVADGFGPNRRATAADLKSDFNRPEGPPVPASEEDARTGWQRLADRSAQLAGYKPRCCRLLSRWCSDSRPGQSVVRHLWPAARPDDGRPCRA